MFNFFPYTDNHQLNLNWILKLFTTLKGGHIGQILTKVGNGDYSWSWEDPLAGVASVNGQTGAVVLDADDVGAIPAPAGAAAGDHLIYDGNSWEATAYHAEDVEYFTYNTSTNAQIYAAYNAGKICLCIYNGYVYSLFNCTPTMAYFSFINDDVSKTIDCVADSWSNSSKILAAANDVHSIPSGGTTGQALTKIDGTDYNVQWQTISGSGAVDSVDGKTGNVTVLPTGGTADQVLAKVDGTNYNVYWKTVSGGGGSGIYWCTYGTTTNAQIEQAISDGLLPVCPYTHPLAGEVYAVLSGSTGVNDHIFTAVPARTTLGGTGSFDVIKLEVISNNWNESDKTPIEEWAVQLNYEKIIKKKTVTFSTSWTDSGNGYYTQTVTITGSTSNSKVDLQVDTSTYATLTTAGVTMLFIENNAGTLTAYLYGTAPAASFTLDCTLTEVS